MEQNWTNPYKNISLTPYRLIAAGGGHSKAVLPDGTLMGASDLKRQLKYPQLFAWNAERKELDNWNKYLQENPGCGIDLVVDSGAYSAWSRGKLFDVDEYIDYLNADKLIDTCFWAAEADVIPGSYGVDPTEEERLAAPQKSWENYLHMIERVRFPKKIVPIFHMGEDYKHLIRMLTYQFKDGDFIPYIGISPRNDMPVVEKVKWYDKTWKVIYDTCKKVGREIPLTHNFGCTTVNIMEQYPSCSSDSTRWLKYAAFGLILVVVNSRTKSINVSNRDLLNPNHINNQPLSVRQAIDDVCAKFGHGLTLQKIVEDDKGDYRALFNLFSLNEWKKNFKYVGTPEFKEDLW